MRAKVSRNVTLSIRTEPTEGVVKTGASLLAVSSSHQHHGEIVHTRLCPAGFIHLQDLR